MLQQIRSFSEADVLSAGAAWCYIYTLHASNDPECRPRYVGFTTNPKVRLCNHKCQGSGRKFQWIKGVLKSGAKVVMKIVHSFRSDDICERGSIEATFIEKFRSQYSDLLNDGGAGTGVAKMSKWHREAISRGNKGKKKSPEHAAKCRVARLGIPHSDEIKYKIGSWARGKKKSPETREKMRQAAQKRKFEKLLNEY